MMIPQAITPAINLLVTGSVDLDGMLQAVRCTVYLMMTTQMDIIHASLVQEERCACEVGMGQVVMFTAYPGMTRRWGTIAIHKDKRFVCRTGTIKTSVTYTVNHPMIPTLVTAATQMEAECVYEAGLVHRAIADQGMILMRVTFATAPLENGSVWRAGLVETAMSSVYLGMTLRVIILVTEALELRSACQIGLAKTVPCTARPGMIPWASTSAQ